MWLEVPPPPPTPCVWRTYGAVWSRSLGRSSSFPSRHKSQDPTSGYFRLMGHNIQQAMEVGNGRQGSLRTIHKLKLASKHRFEQK